MAELKIENARLGFGSTPVLRGVNVSVQSGEFMVIVGPSGCGKSTLLRCIAGLETLDSGTISIGGTDVGHLPPAERGIAMVFQSYALYPHMTVAQNMAFALKLAKQSQSDIDAAVSSAAQILGLTEMLDRKPAALSGGQRQRVAIGRAIVRNPAIFLFDEPLSNLDAALRVKMRYEFADLHKRLKTTTIYVTHDQVEAMTLADRITVLRAGVVEQIGTPQQLYARPCNRFVAGFIGSPQMNFIAANVQSDGTIISPAFPAPLLGPVNGEAGSITVGIRPENLCLVDGPIASNGSGLLSGIVMFVERLGGTSILHVQVNGVEGAVLAQIVGDADVVNGQRVHLSFALDDAHIFDETGNRSDHN